MSLFISPLFLSLVFVPLLFVPLRVVSLLLEEVELGVFEDFLLCFFCELRFACLFDLPDFVLEVLAVEPLLLLVDGGWSVLVPWPAP